MDGDVATCLVGEREGPSHALSEYPSVADAQATTPAIPRA